MRSEVIRLLGETGTNLAAEGIVREVTLHADKHDIHAYYRLSEPPTHAIHVQGYPGMSSSENARVWARKMDVSSMQSLRDLGRSIGNEHEATVEVFPNFKDGIDVPYDTNVFEELLKENIPASLTPPQFR